MEKLIELLNEYEKDKIKNSEGLDVMYIWKYEGTLHYYNNYKDENIFDNVRFLIISKEYGFIDWLVKNDKIEWSEKTAFVTFLEREINADKSDALVSLLAVQDNPIEYLCSILK